MNAIEIKNLKKSFGKTIAVNGISFQVKKGETFGFLGPNGAGKTTTIRCLMDFIRPTEGEIFIFGQNVQENSVETKKMIGYLSGNVKLTKSWSGYDHIRYVEGIRGRSDKAYELAERLGLDLKKKFKNLSSGNKQKLGIVLAVMHQPKLLIMDEPTVGLDPLLQNTIYEILAELKAQGTTILISSHNLPEVERVCDRVGIIKNGQMVAVETLKEIEGKRLHKVEVRFANAFKKSDFEKLAGVEKIEEISGGLILTVSGNLSIIIKKISDSKIADIEITHASLEEIFLKFYERN